jgi:MoaA/NifB/PqqE/SkfB family radical SAM enzyme
VQNRPQMTLETRIPLGNAIPLDTPLVVYVEPSTHCNLACKFCPHYLNHGGFEHGHMSLEIFKKTCNEMLAFPKRVKLLRICGLGDPLFNKQINEFVEYAGINKVAEKIELVTNGLLLREKHLNNLSKNLTRLIVSIEGLNDADYLEFTNRKIDFETFTRTLRAFANLKNRNCKLHIKIHNSAVGTPDRLARFHEIFSDFADELYVENLVNLWPELISNLGLNAGHRFVSKPIDHQIACAQIFKSMQVNFDGKVVPCCIDWKVMNVVGNVNIQTLQEIWMGRQLINLQMRHLSGERNSFSPCAECNMNEESDIDSFDDQLNAVKIRMYEKYQRVNTI